jgi:predicted HicB family RNase H-like nuclease
MYPAGCRTVTAGGQPHAIRLPPTTRLDARISTKLHAMLKRAAEIQGRSLTNFVASAVRGRWGLDLCL